MEEIYVTSRSRTPSLIDVHSQNERVFSQLPDLIQEAAVSTECSLSQYSCKLLLRVASFESQATNKSSPKCKEHRYTFHDTAYVLRHNEDRFRYRLAGPQRDGREDIGQIWIRSNCQFRRHQSVWLQSLLPKEEYLHRVELLALRLRHGIHLGICLSTTCCN